MSDAIGAAIADFVERYNTALEQACVIATQAGCGVTVKHMLDGGVFIMVDPDVPAGEIHEHHERVL